MKAKPKGGQYRAKTLASAAGISTNLLRAWERRYQIFEPERQASGHRLYTEDDLTVLRRVCELTRTGIAVGEAVALGRENLLDLGRPDPEKERSLSSLTEISLERQDLIAQLAPSDLRVHRPDRYAGEGLGISLRLLHPSDLCTVYQLYRTLKSLYEIWIYMEQRVVRPLLLGRLKSLFDPAFMAELGVLGAATPGSEPFLRGALEDARGGALAVLLDYCSGRNLDQLNFSDLQIVLTLARDHAKMMRNSFYDLDEVVRKADESPKAHSILPIVNKLQAFHADRVDFRAGCTFDGPVSSRCLETSALDRLTYQMLARCLDPARSGAGLWVTQVNDSLSRWAFECSVEKFRMPDPSELPVLILSLAMGVSADDVLDYAYLGSARRAGSLWAWFHWPIYNPPADVPHCLCDPLTQR